MNRRNKFVTGMCLFAIVLGLSASVAKAEEATFTLPFQARWGRQVLEPGQYRMVVPSSTSGIQVFELTGNGKTILLPTGGISYGMESDRSYLELVNSDGMYTVREFNSGATGKSFRFPVWKTGANDKGGKATAVAVTEANHK